MPGFRARLTTVPGVTAKGLLTAGPMWLPVLLGDVSFEESAEHVEYTTIAAGGFSVAAPGGRDARSLRAFDVETLTVMWDVPWLTGLNLLSPADIRRELREILRARTAVKLLITSEPDGETMWSSNVTLRSFARQHRFGQPGIVYYDLAISEWRDPSVKRRSAGGAGSLRGIVFPVRHKLAAADTGNTLSKKFYGDFKSAKKILADIGLKTWGANTPIVESRRFKAGSVIVIGPPVAGLGGTLIGAAGAATAGIPTR